MTGAISSKVGSRRLSVFAGTVVVLTSCTVFAGFDPEVTPFVLVLIPPLAALLATGLTGGRGEMRRLFTRVRHSKVGLGWYLVAIAIPVVEKLGVVLLGLAMGATTPRRLTEALTASALVVPLVVAIPALLEEFGWRRFGVQTAIDSGRSPGWAAAVIGSVFVLIHIPIYLPGQIYDDAPLWPIPIWLMAGSVLLTWIFVRSGSLLVAALMHAAFNATVPLTWGLDPSWVWQARAVVVVAIVAVIVGQTGWQWWLRPPQMRPSQERPAESRSGLSATRPEVIGKLERTGSRTTGGRSK